MVFMTVLALMALLGALTSSLAQETHFAALDAINELPTCFSGGEGTFIATINEEDTAIDYQLSHGGLSGTVTQAHIHFGKPFEQGGIIVFLCSNLPNPPANTPACPVSPGSVQGTLDASSDVSSTAAQAQGINAGDFAKLLVAIRFGDGFTYANVHSTVCPSGEIRGQIR